MFSANGLPQVQRDRAEKWTSPRTSRFLRRLVVAGALGVGLLAGLYAGRQRLLPAMANWLDVGGPLQEADYVLPLGSGEDSRVMMAAAIVKAGWAPRVLVTKTVVSPEAKEGIIPPTYEIYRTVLRHYGIPDRDVLLLGDEIDHTYGEIQALAEFLQSAPQARVLIVTDGYHTRRTRLAVSYLLKDRPGQVSLISSPSDTIAPQTWWRHEEGFEEVLAEHFKLLFYAVHYGWLGYEIGAGAALTLMIWIWRRRRAKPQG